LAGKIKAVIVDTYALMADLTSQATPVAARILDSIRLGIIKGIIHYFIVYELSYHWMKGHLPFHDEKELMEFINTYFNIHDLDPGLAIEASRIKLHGDRLLRSAGEKELRHRKLSVCDSTTIALAKRLNTPIVTGDKDLTYVAREMGVKVLW